MLDFASGLVAMGYLTGGVFFLKFWVRTGEGLFGAFSIAFALLALEQVLLAWAHLPREEEGWFYLIRLSAFLVIIGAISWKNRKPR